MPRHFSNPTDCQYVARSCVLCAFQTFAAVNGSTKSMPAHLDPVAANYMSIKEEASIGIRCSTRSRFSAQSATPPPPRALSEYSTHSLSYVHFQRVTSAKKDNETSEQSCVGKDLAHVHIHFLQHFLRQFCVLSNFFSGQRLYEIDARAPRSIGCHVSHQRRGIDRHPMLDSIEIFRSIVDTACGFARVPHAILRRRSACTLGT